MVDVAAPKLSEEEMQMIYNWVDEIPLSRPKRNIARDFSDGVLVAEIVKHFVPHIVELHNYSAAHSVSQKTYNWNTLNQKIFKKLGFTLIKKDMEDAVNCVPDTIERILKVLQANIASYQENKAKKIMMAKGSASGSDGEFENHVQTFAAPNQNKENQQHHIQHHQHIHPVSQGHHKQQMHNMGGIDQEIILEKDQTIQQLKETIEILELKVKKLEQLVKLKDAKILNLSNKLQTAGIMQ